MAAAVTSFSLPAWSADGNVRSAYVGDDDYSEVQQADAEFFDSEFFDSEYSAVEQVGYSCESYCDTCNAPQSHCNCDMSSLPGRFAHHLHKRCCPAPWWAHRTGGFGEFLYLRPGSSDLIYATEQTDPDPTVASPTGPLGMTSIQAEGGFRVGLTLAASDCSSVALTYARWDGDDQSRLVATGFNVLASNVIHPSTLTSGAASLEAIASHQQSFQTMDLKYRHLWRHTDTTALNWFGGVRYGNLQQRFTSDQTVSVATGLTNVTTDIDFDGFGLTGGADFETFSCTTGLSMYGIAQASLLAGEWNATYDQTNQFGGGVIANRYEDFHATPVLDAELGLRWTGPKRHLRLSSGLLMSGWYNTLTTRSYIDSVRAAQLTDAGETQTFSGLTARVEYRF